MAKFGSHLTHEDRVINGRKGQEVRKRNYAARKADPLWGIKARLSEHFSELEKAARGEGSWKDLPATSRLQALQSVIAYGIGRPVSVDKQSPAVVASEGGGVDEAGTLKFE